MKYCGVATPFRGVRAYTLHLSASKTTICPQSTTILGWVWTQGQLSASQHRVATLSSCPPPDTVRGLRSFIGAYKPLAVSFQTAPNSLHHSIRSLQAKNPVTLYSGQVLYLYTSLLPKMLSRNTSPLRSHDHPTIFGL